MKNRFKAYTRHQRERVIQKKWSILKEVQLREDGWMPARGILSKGKVHCSCRMCKYEKHYSIPKAKLKAKWNSMQKEIEEIHL